MGETALSVDFYKAGELSGPETRSQSFGLAVVQQIESRNIEVFGLFRRYEYADATIAYQPGRAVMAGLRLKF